MNPYVISSDANSFDADVLVNSNERPVLVDFWAEWCAPCRSIAPVLEQLANDLAGKLLVVKIDTDAEQGLAQQYGIRSLPTLLLFRDAEIVEQIIGVQPAGVIQAAVEKYLPRHGDMVLEQIAEQREAGDYAAALAALTQAAELDPSDSRLNLAQADVMLDLGDAPGAESVLSELPVAVATGDAAKRLESRIRLAKHAKQKVGDDPTEREFARAANLAVEKEFEEALETLLELIISKRDWKDGLIQSTILDIFAVLGSSNPRLKEYRTRLARTLN